MRRRRFSAGENKKRVIYTCNDNDKQTSFPIYLSIYLDLGVWGFGVFLFRGRGIRLEGLIGKRIGEGRGVYSDSASIFLVVGMGMVYGQHSPPDAILDTYKTRIMGLLMNS